MSKSASPQTARQSADAAPCNNASCINAEASCCACGGTHTISLADLPLEASVCVAKVGGDGALRQHLLDMGLIPGTTVRMIKHAPMGDPVQVRLHGYDLTLRLDDARKIETAPFQAKESDETHAAPAKKTTPARDGLYPDKHPHSADHPGFGEGGRYHDAATETPLPEDTLLTFALVGNQNSGKTTLFNQLTGANQHVGNFPGVTIDRIDGALLNHRNTRITDLPGIYSMSPYSSEERVTRQFVLEEKPCAIINIVDATNIERNMYLTIQLLELGIPMVLALNMIDELTENGGSILVNELEARLGIPVVPISALKGQGIDELVDHALHVARFQEAPQKQDFCSPDDASGAIHRCLHGLMHLVEDHAVRANIPTRFAASKLAEGDELVEQALDLDKNERETIEHLITQMEAESGLDRSAALAKMRFAFIERVCKDTVIKPQESKEHKRSARIDSILTGRFTAIPVFILIMAAVFWLTFSVVGAKLQEALADGIAYLGEAVAQAMEAAQINEVVCSLVSDGIFSGVGSIVSFLPLIVVLFFFLSILEDSGYMARVAFVMDKPLRKLGLSGRSIVPMLIGFGCSVPSVMASRSLPSERDRKMTVLLTPFMSCSAKLPVYVFLCAAFFPEKTGLVIVVLYLMGIVTGMIVSVFMKKFVWKGEAMPFVMELPNYRMPAARNVAHLLWDKSKDFLQRAFTVIFVATLIIWFLQTFSFSLNVVHDSSESILALIAGAIAPVFAPLGLGDWRICTALISGFISKESVIATLSVLFGGASAMSSVLTPLTGFCLLVFCLLYTPCVAAIASIRRELGTRWSLGVVVGQCAIAWIAALLVRLAGMALGFV